MPALTGGVGTWAPWKALERILSKLGGRLHRGRPSRSGISVSDVDFVTALCSQVVYEGLVDDTFRVKCGKWHLSETEGSSAPGASHGEDAGLVGETQAWSELLPSK